MFVDIGNGRLRCVATGHKVVAYEESYARKKRYRLGLIDHMPFSRASGKRTGSSGKTKKTRGGKEDTDSDEADFWMLKSSSGSESEHEGDEENCKGSHCDAKVSEELSERTKRMSIEIGPSSFASRKKKIRNDESC
ncbi:unnamed protein product [Microthlaspi erraticum]|uniref:Uncharacterized protein n=1 Tax=Microthlaspi erraticum TaxID=1685480 RepID=A0A6D2KPJ7_9BRAS|nr:unnamed protein product [Microthlaspi erraticum]